LISGFVPAGVVTSAAGVVPEVLALIFFKKDHELRQQVSANDARIQHSQMFLTAVQVAETIGDPTQQNSAKTKIIERILGEAA